MKKKIKPKKKGKEAPEIISQDNISKLQETLDYFENELEGNADYIKRELSKKWYSKEKIREKEKEIPSRKPEKTVSKSELNKLQKISSYFEKKLNRNEDYIKKELPKKWAFRRKHKKEEIKEKPVRKAKKAVSKEKMAVLQDTSEHFKKKLEENIKYLKKLQPESSKGIPSKLNELIEERKRILAEIIAVRDELKSLEDERVRLEKEVFRKQAENQITGLQRYEHFVGEKLNKNINLYKAKRKRKSIKIVNKKIPVVKPKKAVVSEQEINLLQENLDKLNKELELINKKTND